MTPLQQIHTVARNPSNWSADGTFLFPAVLRDLLRRLNAPEKQEAIMTLDECRLAYGDWFIMRII